MRLEKLYSHAISPGNDAPPPGETPRKLMVCTTPRTAGHHLCQILAQFGLGFPTEYFQWQYALPLMQRWSGDEATDLRQLSRRAADYGNYLVQNRSVDGVFSAKLFYENLDFMRRSLGADDDAWLYIFLTRRNKVDQTISLLSMLHTGRPFDSQEVLTGIPRIATFDEENIRNVALFISASEANWQRMLSDIDKSRIVRVDFEDVISQPSKTLSSTVGRWFPDIDFGGKAMPSAGKYRSDSVVKERLNEEFGDYIRSLW
jgi:LPS sulfotransferase NodH